MDKTSLRIQVQDRAPTPDIVERVREVLERGALAALPTETVYGLAARADRPDALRRLMEAKERPPIEALTWHAGDAAALEAFPRISPMAERLAAKYWPGPLTLVLPGVPAGLELVARDDWTGVRVPAQIATQKLLAALEFPVVMSSANKHGEAPALTADEVERQFGGRVNLIVDGGPSRMGESSSVLRLGRGKFELLRPGLFTIEQLRAVAGLKIAFVCTGNTCRSPMAEGLARKFLAERLGAKEREIAAFGFSVMSMGVFASNGAPASKHSVDVLAQEGIDISHHRSKTATLEEVSRMDRVYGLTRGHVEELRKLLPPGKAKSVALLDPDGGDVSDPIGGTVADYERTAAQIRSAIEARLDEWA
ncbi:MAG: L-threonylcarbamoyladenylate synthase [Planctomycetota bacterium]|nr:L-threonylcarbamoyladenylate synthase [Planctomycetota bacterium]